MDFAAVVSLNQTIKRLLNAYDISLVPPSPKILDSARRAVESFIAIIDNLEGRSHSSSRRRTRVTALDGQIKEAVCNLEDVIESHVSNQIVSQSYRGDPIRFSIDVQDLKQNIQSFIGTLKKMEEKYSKELHLWLEEEEEEEEEDDDDDQAVSSRLIDFGGKKSKVVGLSDDLSKIKDQLTGPPGWRSWRDTARVFAIFGMAGIGKTTVAKEIFEDPLVVRHFKWRAWVTVGKKYQSKEILRSILAQVDPDSDKMHIQGISCILSHLNKCLKSGRFLIVLDDIWDSVLPSYFKRLYGDERDTSFFLLTSRREKVAYRYGLTYNFHKHQMRLLNKKESWDLLTEKVFGEDSCPPQLEKHGKMIAENCDGLPLMIIMVADALSKAEKTPEYWGEVSTQKKHQIFIDAYDEISKVLYPSYEYLDLDAKMCFLYMGLFPQNYEITKTKLAQLWGAEGFLEVPRYDLVESYANDCLKKLISENLVLLYQEGTFLKSSLLSRIKTCRIQSSLWYLCNTEATKNKLFHVLNNCVDGLAEDIKSQRRLCIHNNILLAIKDVSNSMKHNCASTARSLICFGSYNQYPVPICFSLRLLRILDALAVRFYEFPMEILKLILLRYLALTYNGKLPASLSKLWNLQFLIVRHHVSIKSSRAPSYLPVEIWNMKELKHLQITGSDLPDPCGASLQSLLTLLNVSAFSCTKGVFKAIPNLTKLGIQIELVPDADESWSCFDHIYILERLYSLKCVIVNPEFRYRVAAPLNPNFTSGLHKLTLSGLGYPWEDMNIISSLPRLRVLKLRCYAFRGPKWGTEENEFPELDSLLIEDTDLVQWKVGRGSFPSLRFLSIKHCYKLKELDMEFVEHLQRIEIVDCSPSIVTCVKLITEAKQRTDSSLPEVCVQSSWDDGNRK